MKTLIFALLAASAWGQTCSHATKYAPSGPLLLYRNGVLLQEGPGFSTAKVPGTQRCCLVTPLAFGDGDLMSAVMTRAVAATLTVGGQPVAYTAYVLWRTDWSCSGSSGAQQLVLRLDPAVVPGLWHAATPLGREYYVVDWPPK